MKRNSPALKSHSLNSLQTCSTMGSSNLRPYSPAMRSAASSHSHKIAMTDSETPPAPAPSLTLLPAALHFPIEPHPDSDQHRQNDKHRTAKELRSILPSSSSRKSLSRSPNLAPRPGPSSSSRSLYIYPRSSSIRSSPFLRSRQPRLSDASTVPDDGWEREAWRYRLKRQTPHWYDGIFRFWGRQISVVVDQGQQRDHLGRREFSLTYPTLNKYLLGSKR